METKLDEIRKILKTIMGEDNMELKDQIVLLVGVAGACHEGLQELAATKSRLICSDVSLIILSFAFKAHSIKCISSL